MNKHEQATPHAGAECNTIVKYITQGRGERAREGEERACVDEKRGLRERRGVSTWACVDERGLRESVSMRGGVCR